MTRHVLALDVESTGRPCETCGEPLTRKTWLCGTRESPSSFAQRKFCSRACRLNEASLFVKQIRLDQAPGCHIWTGALNNMGYGQVRVRGKTRLAHRVAYERAHGPLPAGLNALHSCDTPACVNAAHLHPGTHHENVIEKVERGRDPNHQKTTCPAGHSYDIKNTYVWRGRRFCRRCNVIASAKRDERAAKKAGFRIEVVP